MAILKSTKGVINNQVITTNVGSPEGHVLSPFFWSAVCNNLLKDLSAEQDPSEALDLSVAPVPPAPSSLTTLCYCDDVVVTAEGVEDLKKAYTVIKSWSE